MYNPRRQEAAAKLPPAPQTMLHYAWERCLEAGIAIPQEDFTHVIRSVVDYLNTTGEGKRVMLQLLKATQSEATYLNQYYQTGHLGEEEKRLDYKGLIEFKGWIYRGRAVPHNAVEIWDKPDLEACEMCCGLFPKSHCLITVKTTSNGKEHLENMCNHCRLMYDDNRIKETASSKTCGSCKITNCRYHPAKQQALRAEKAATVIPAAAPGLIPTAQAPVAVKPPSDAGAARYSTL